MKEQIEKQAIEEMAFDLCRIDTCKHLSKEECNMTTCDHCEAEALYNAGYRKQREGEWVKAGDGITERVICSNCKSEKGSFMRPPFCNQCGAHMKGGAE